jgi:hypothetical protein
MRTKNLFYAFFVFIACFFVCKYSNANPNFQQLTSFENEVTDELNNTTPLQSCALSLKSYLDDQANENYESNSATGDLVSRTAIFNQTFLQYVKEGYNKPEMTDLLSRDGSDIAQFLKITSDLNLDTSIAYVGMRLFHNKIKSCDLILGKVSNGILENFNEYLSRYFENQEDFYRTEVEIIRKNLEKMILNKLSDQFAQQETLDASNIAKQISDEIAMLINQGLNQLQEKIYENTTKERLRQVTLRFVETLLNKTVWDDNDAEQIWPSFILISNNIQRMAGTGIINHFDDLDDLLWSLTHCFCRYFTSFGISVPTAIYAKIEQALRKNSVPFLEEPEQDEGIKTKKEHLYEALFKAKIKAYAYEKQGIISQTMN